MKQNKDTKLEEPRIPACQSAADCSATACPICGGDYATADLAFRLGHRPDVAFAKLRQCQRSKLSNINELLYAVVYKDDGPSGICGQSCSITTPWVRLYLLSSYEAVKVFTEKLSPNNGRKNSRVEYIFYPQPDADDIFVID